MIVWYKHEAWVMSVLFMANIHSRVYGEDANSVKQRFQNDSVWTPNDNVCSSQNDSVSGLKILRIYTQPVDTFLQKDRAWLNHTHTRTRARPGRVRSGRVLARWVVNQACARSSPSTKPGCPLGPKPHYKMGVHILFKSLVPILCGTQFTSLKLLLPFLSGDVWR